jgi:hypothetical protein
MFNMEFEKGDLLKKSNDSCYPTFLCIFKSLEIYRWLTLFTDFLYSVPLGLEQFIVVLFFSTEIPSLWDL